MFVLIYIHERNGLKKYTISHKKLDIERLIVFIEQILIHITREFDITLFNSYHTIISNLPLKNFK